MAVTNLVVAVLGAGDCLVREAANIQILNANVLVFREPALTVSAVRVVMENHLCIGTAKGINAFVSVVAGLHIYKLGRGNGLSKQEPIYKIVICSDI